MLNTSGRRLLELCSKHNLVVTNTLFKHKMCHTSTWTAPERIQRTRRNPIRNQIYFIIVRNNNKNFVTDSRSYFNIKTDTDHKMVIMAIKYKWYQLYNNKRNNTQNINIENFNNKNNQKKYKEALENFQINKNIKPKEKWEGITKVC